MAKKVQSVLHFYAYHVCLVTDQQEYIEIDGRVRALNRETLIRHLDWMAENDYDNARIVETEIAQVGDKTELHDGDLTVIFDEGPVPSFINDDPGGSDVPWDEEDWYDDQNYWDAVFEEYDKSKDDPDEDAGKLLESEGFEDWEKPKFLASDVFASHVTKK